MIAVVTMGSNTYTTVLTTVSTVVDNGSACKDESPAGKAVQEKETHTHTPATSCKTKPKETHSTRKNIQGRDGSVTGNACFITYSNLNILLAVWTCPHESCSENTLLNNGILRFFNENLCFYVFVNFSHCFI